MTPEAALRSAADRVVSLIKGSRGGMDAELGVKAAKTKARIVWAAHPHLALPLITSMERMGAGNPVADESAAGHSRV